ncbi:response regulator [Chitinimonas koreensis]|uniref:response regulator n=1 Tax=Chitinimonas koreensis TaxID=356302 RepID=UPI000400DB2A|nr:response regulator [Chitinimonas koreensis]QNM95395.1 response regulator [Chitinimonas koreensis]
MEEFEQIRILLVEDNPVDAELTMYGLRSDNLSNTIVWVKDGDEALDYVFRRGAYAGLQDPLPGLVLLDLKMPHVSGTEVLAALKADEQTRRIPVVVMTSSQEECDIMKSYDLGANSYVVKPVDFEGITSVAKQTGIYWMAVNRRAPH